MNYEVIDDEIIFTVDTDRLGKGAILYAIEQVEEFWRTVKLYATFKRKNFETVTIKINRVDVP